MSRLTPKQAAYVAAFADLGDHRRAAEIAGFSPKTIRNAAWRLKTKPHVQAACAKAAEAANAEDGPFSRAGIRNLARAAKSEEIKLRALIYLHERVYGRTPERVELAVRDGRTDDDLRAAIAARLAADPALAALLSGAPLIDGTASPALPALETAFKAAGHAVENGTLTTPSARSDHSCQQPVNGAGQEGTP